MSFSSGSTVVNEWAYLFAAMTKESLHENSRTIEYLGCRSKVRRKVLEVIVNESC